MWIYKFDSRKNFEKKNFVDTILWKLGCTTVNIQLPYEQKTTMHTADFTETFISKRPLYQYKTCYIHIDEVPFPYDLSDDEIVQEVKYSLKKQFA